MIKAEKRLSSLVRERQRIWQAFFNNSGQVRITLEANGQKTVFREGVCFPGDLIDFYLRQLDIRIEQAITELQGETELRLFLEHQGYRNLRNVPGRGWCGIERMIFTWALWYGMDRFGKSGRYCFDSLSEVVAALNAWSGKGDPPGDWIKHFGDGFEVANPDREGLDPAYRG